MFTFLVEKIKMNVVEIANAIMGLFMVIINYSYIAICLVKDVYLMIWERIGNYGNGNANGNATTSPRESAIDHMNTITRQGVSHNHNACFVEKEVERAVKVEKPSLNTAKTIDTIPHYEVSTQKHTCIDVKPCHSVVDVYQSPPSYSIIEIVSTHQVCNTMDQQVIDSSNFKSSHIKLSAFDSKNTPSQSMSPVLMCSIPSSPTLCPTFYEPTEIPELSIEPQLRKVNQEKTLDCSEFSKRTNFQW